MSTDIPDYARKDAVVVDPSGAFFCESCTRRYAAKGDCPKCPGEPLLDLRNEDVIHMLQEFDSARWRKRAAIYSVIAGVPGLVLGVLGCGAVGWVVSLGLGLTITLAGSAALMAIAPPKKRCPPANRLPA